MDIYKDNQIEQILATAMTKIRSLAETDTVIGRPILTPDGVTIIPVSKVTMGFLAGGGEYGDKPLKHDGESQFAGGSGAAVTMTPMGFLVSGDKSIKVLPMETQDSLSKLADVASNVYNTFKDRLEKNRGN